MTVLDDLCELIVDCEHKTAPKSPSGYPSIRTPNVGRGRLILDGVNRVDEETYIKWTRRAVPKKDDLIIAREAPVGNVAIVRKGQEVCLGQRTVLVRPDPSLVEPEFLCYFMLGEYVQTRFMAAATGATVPHLNMSDLRSLPIPELPALPTQRRIASILSTYDDLIENNTRRIEILEEMARRLYEEWFVHFRFPGHEQVSFKETELGRVPEGWEVKTVADTFEIFGGGTPSKKEPSYWEGGTINWFSPTDLTRAGTAFMDSSGAKITDIGLRKSSARMFPAFSVMMTSRATLGVISINTTEACTNQGFITCLPSKRFPLYLLYYWLNANVETFISLGTGATFKEITKGTFKTIPLAVPSLQVANQFQDDVSPLMSLALNLQRKNANLRTQRDLLLPKLVSGEIDVSELPMPNDTEDEAA